MPVKECMRRGATFSASKDGSAGGVVLKKLSPTAPGAKRLATRYGKALVCVRYREDLARGRRLTTVELVVDERPCRRRSPFASAWASPNWAAR